MSPYTESVNSPVMLPPISDEPHARARIKLEPESESASRATPAPRRPIRAVERMAPGHQHQRATQRARSWRDAIQAFAHDAAEMPVIARLLAGQGILLLGYASVYGALALLRRLHGISVPRPVEPRPSARAPHRPRPLLVGVTAATGLALAWAALVFIARTRAIPAVTALFTYGAALRQYVRPLRPPTRAA